MVVSFERGEVQMRHKGSMRGSIWHWRNVGRQSWWHQIQIVNVEDSIILFPSKCLNPSNAFKDKTVQNAMAKLQDTFDCNEGVKMC
jgi:hypothetical protein